MKLRELDLSFDPQEGPNWECPRCGRGRLRFEQGGLVSFETPESLAQGDDPSWEADWILERFGGVLRCSDNDCGELVAVAGEGRYEETDPRVCDDPSVQATAVLHPRFVFPAPRLTPDLTAMPTELLSLLRRCDELFWSDYAGCMNAIRVALEAALTHLKVRRYVTSKGAKGRRVRLPLHQRLEAFAKKHPELRDKLMALKHVGNAGSHAGHPLDREDVLIALELLGNVLEYVYEGSNKRLAGVAKQIVKAKGPLSRRRSRTPR
jgi:hypothetical protein